MPERKGRKRRPAERRRAEYPPDSMSSREEPSELPPALTRQSPQLTQSPPLPLPSPTARASGLLIGVITLIFAILVLRDGLTGDHTTIDATLRIVAGIGLLLLALAVGVLVLLPEVVRRLLAGRRRYR